MEFDSDYVDDELFENEVEEEGWNESLLDEPKDCVPVKSRISVKCHERCIIHIDIDCFYAQVEMIKNPQLRDRPMGVQQKNLVVTTNYAARNVGVPKSCWIPAAMKACPDLILVNGEDLHDYRQYSQKIFDFLKSFKVPVEKLGMDENYMDVTRLVSQQGDPQATLAGHHLYSSNESVCKCGCNERLKIASDIAQRIRAKLYEDLSITSSAGIAHNKLLAKMVGSRHKPNDQTTIFPCDADKFLSEISDVGKLPGIGSAMRAKLKENELSKISVIRESSRQRLSEIFEGTIASKIWDFCHGIDVSEVKMSAPSKSIGVEDRFKGITNRDQSIKHLGWLLDRLSLLVYEDGRLPTVIQVTARDHNKAKLLNKFMRESRQSKISPELFRSFSNERILEENARSKVLSIAVDLLGKMIPLDTTFHMTLLGISVSGFNETNNKNIASFFKPSTNIFTPTTSASTASTPSKKRLVPASTLDPPSPKRTCVSEESSSSGRSNFFQKSNAAAGTKDSATLSSQTEILEIPSGWDKDVFKELPTEIQQELLATTHNPSVPNKPQSSKGTKPKKNSICNYFSKDH